MGLSIVKRRRRVLGGNGILGWSPVPCPRDVYATLGVRCHYDKSDCEVIPVRWRNLARVSLGLVSAWTVLVDGIGR